MNRAHAVGCPALRGRPSCTCQPRPVKPPRVGCPVYRFEHVERIDDLSKLLTMGMCRACRRFDCVCLATEYDRSLVVHECFGHEPVVDTERQVACPTDTWD